MPLVFKFKKEKIDGIYVYRPRILITLSGATSSVDIPALIDTGCDTTVIPKGIAEAIGLDMKGEKTHVCGFREKNEVIVSKADITFVDKNIRNNVKLNVPVLIALPKENLDEEEDINLGIQGIFENFDITFSRIHNRIVFKKVTNTILYRSTIKI